MENSQKPFDFKKVFHQNEAQNASNSVPIQKVANSSVPSAPAAPTNLAGNSYNATMNYSAPVQNVNVPNQNVNAPAQNIQKEPMVEFANPVQNANIVPNEQVTSTGLGEYAVEVSSGETLSNFPIDRFPYIVGTSTRVACLRDTFLATKTHFIPGLRNFYCFKGLCCQLDTKKFAQTKYLVPIIVYDTDMNGVFRSNKWTIKFAAISSTVYQQLCANMIRGPLSSQDFLWTVTAAPNNPSVKNSSIVYLGPAEYKKSPEFEKAVKDKLESVEKYILDVFAAKHDETSLRAALQRKAEKDKTNNFRSNSNSNLNMNDFSRD